MNERKRKDLKRRTEPTIVPGNKSMLKLWFTFQNQKEQLVQKKEKALNKKKHGMEVTFSITSLGHFSSKLVYCICFFVLVKNLL